MKKPIQLRIIFILNAIMMVLPFVFYYIFQVKNIVIEGFDPINMIYTGIGYIVSFIILVILILRKNLIGIRVIFVLNVLIGIPAKAYIGFGVAAISAALSLTKQVRTYFSS